MMMNRKSIPMAVLLPLAARLAVCREGEILSLRATEEGGLVVIGPSGRKMVFSAADVAKTRAGPAAKAPETGPGLPLAAKKAKP